ncbi:L-seryl-tRNA(Sec) selenium transferase [Bradyrhizobium sp. U87765 SZCCT0131]|uniref:L-seryl-tRNA(Sec) selenium transferase n=1 Tax=unclassified Bradyrhizobium TaxID=2631580 RepID=UPI001BA7EE6C|nr:MULTISPECIES: L-seryl-tRNA(Sec) selenium transferase [unclassified Bradyrhizobium]MBR1222178.1 L-seryl-tRNA(Sec) selenium transferase [Bradyrhizobium sp. U87765 SZCCT0131]MBR1265693.1 L-seryl-tRNA(Sec) selenium transferase [Bradyrhizobium sp. U87765 SZCCT0134]MBR1307879.1 L-seryl-tRNA(Sec) selenium transferase [Bradyrhizobium sp. U87765 SZCCT0110]MBR1324011.1 L-seryl-tRNA(Sec) selenium transferase [Bradyrhizobium sp. U87765 SZCCT0109]MBR1348299.1 L-seryl-tRNA(Sec) selenium transferase [Brad
MKTPDLLRALPSVSTLLTAAESAALRERYGRQAATDALRAVLGDARETIKAGGTGAPSDADLVARAHAVLDGQDRSALRPLFNLTGIVLHTNLGRAVLAEDAIAAVVAAMRDAVALEYDLATGRRGERDDHVRGLLCELTGAEDATVVNNNAAAVLLCLNTLADGREAVVSRGELIEIGGAFRMPAIMARAGARLVEVGTTNRTHARDYREALTPHSGVVLKVHTSNYRIQGFTAEVAPAELAGIARSAGVPLLHDLGSGTLVDLGRYGLKREPTVREAVADGADLVTFSGDKLLGGPQAGFIVGKAARIAEINRNPMKRALRVDKMRLAAIEATLKLYRDPDRLAERLPTLRALARARNDIMTQAERLRPQLARLLGERHQVEVTDCDSQVGSGALPLDTLPSAGLRIRCADGRALERLAAGLRGLPRPVIGRTVDDALVLDLRCLMDDAALLATLSALDLTEAP